MATILGLLLWLVAQQPVGSIEGTAVRAGTAQAIPGLQVELWPTARVANTDAYGKFGFQGVEPGSYTLFVENNGIGTRTPIKMLAGQKLTGIAMKINFAPTISGTIFDHNSERVAGVRVQAFQLRFSPYGRRMRAVASTLTNDRGEYRLSRLRPGEYYVSASYSETDQRLGKGDSKLTPNLSNPDEGLPPMYFGGSFNPNESTRVRLGLDLDTANADIFLKEAKRFAVSGQIIQGCARLAIVPDGGSLNTETDFNRLFCDSFTIKGVSPGTYFLVAVGEGFSSEPVRFSVSSQDAKDIKVTLVRATTVTGQITQDGQRGGGPRGAFFAPSVNWGDTKVTLARNSRDFEWKTSGKISADGTFAVANVGPGTYDVLVEPMPERLFLKNVRGGAQDLLVNSLRVDANPTPPLNIVVSSMGATVDGTVVDRAGDPASGAQIVLIPNFSTREDLIKVAWANRQGKFHIEGISPANYTALAFEDIPPGAQLAIAYDPALNWLRGGGRSTVIRVGESGQIDLSLRMIPASETDGAIR